MAVPAKLTITHQEVDEQASRLVKMKEEFARLTGTYNNDISQYGLTLSDENRKREARQAAATKSEGQLFDATNENAQLKKQNFKLKSTLNRSKQRSELAKNQIRLLQDKLRLLEREQSAVINPLQAELSRLQQDLSYKQQVLVQTKDSFSETTREFEVINATIVDQKANEFQHELARLERGLRDAEQARDDAQRGLDSAHREQQVSMQQLTDPLNEKMKSTQQLLGTLNKLSDELRDTAKTRAETLDKRNSLMKSKHEIHGREELMQDYENARDGYESMNQDVRLQIDGIQKEIERVLLAIVQGQDELRAQAEHLGQLKTNKRDQECELERLRKQINDLTILNQRYERDIARLEDEKSQLLEDISNLQDLLEARETELETKQRRLAQLKYASEWLQMKLREQAKEAANSVLLNAKKDMFSFMPEKGDMLDQMLAHYVNESGCRVPIKKLGDGFYLFGTRKIYAKIQAGKLIIRVGGGWMIITEFIEHYADEEMRKLEALRTQGIDPHAPEPVVKSSKVKNKVKAGIDSRLMGVKNSSLTVDQKRLERMHAASPNAVRRID